jgi:hypothetical protein
MHQDNDNFIVPSPRSQAWAEADPEEVLVDDDD